MLGISKYVFSCEVKAIWNQLQSNKYSTAIYSWRTAHRQMCGHPQPVLMRVYFLAVVFYKIIWSECWSVMIRERMSQHERLLSVKHGGGSIMDWARMTCRHWSTKHSELYKWILHVSGDNNHNHSHSTKEGLKKNKASKSSKPTVLIWLSTVGWLQLAEFPV